MGKKAVFFDVDGTLIDCTNGMNYVLDSTKEAINKIKSNGDLAVLATGRPKSFLYDEITKLDFDAYITSNGAYVELDGKVIYNRTIDKETIYKVISMCEKENMEYVFEGQELSYFSDFNSKNIKQLISAFSIQKRCLIDKPDSKDILANKMVLIFDNEKQKELSYELLKDQFTFMRHPGENSYDIYFKDCTKADGIKRLIDYLNIEMEDTFAFGDGINDIEMLQTVGCGIAMGNANEKLKKVANLVTDDVFSHGIYNALISLQLIA
ncbi:Cof-type HAD-IIB family hydrolase [Candidatus Clostridium stratigraminis]|uniref:Cof-type HAD-IIB family hydrolase n=1 Tax=Candidatus Clostridium stratigraminis TaxID=3381661 RepID=A0ABW8SZI5_9CLOT